MSRACLIVSPIRFSFAHFDGSQVLFLSLWQRAVQITLRAVKERDRDDLYIVLLFYYLCAQIVQRIFSA